MQNFLMLLGWAPPGDQEIMPFDELARLWRLEDVHSSPAYFDVKKLEAFNGEYIRAMSVDEFVERSQPWLVAPHASWPPEQFDRGAFEAMAPLVQTRVTRLIEVPAMVDFIFLEEPAIDPASWDKVMKTDTAPVMLDGAIKAYADAPWDADTLKAALEMVGEGVGLKLGKAQAPVRVATTGRTVGPPLFESLVVLGRERTLARLRAARARV
jgi:glutamyl-tRNA synthetase